MAHGSFYHSVFNSKTHGGLRVKGRRATQAMHRALDRRYVRRARPDR